MMRPVERFDVRVMDSERLELRRPPQDGIVGRVLMIVLAVAIGIALGWAPPTTGAGMMAAITAPANSQ